MHQAYLTLELRQPSRAEYHVDESPTEAANRTLCVQSSSSSGSSSPSKLNLLAVETIDIFEVDVCERIGTGGILWS